MIDHDEAAIVERIFRDYAAGKSPKAIAEALNREGVLPPQGGRDRTKGIAGWSQSTINGNRKRGTGILNNELYVGRRIWGRLTYSKHPDTGNRLSRPADAAERREFNIPELRIIPQELWDEVKKRQGELDERLAEAAAKGETGGPNRAARRPVYPLSGLVRCGECEGGFSVISQRRLGCSTRANKGKHLCSNTVSVPYSELEQAVLMAIDTDMMRSDALKDFTRRYNDRVDDAGAAIEAERKDCQSRLTSVNREVNHIVDAIASIGQSTALRERLAKAEREKAQLELRLAVLKPPKVAAFKESDQERFRAHAAAVRTMVLDPDKAVEANRLLHELVDRVLVYPPEAGIDLPYGLIIEGNLPEMIRIMEATDADHENYMAWVASLSPEKLAELYADEIAEAQKALAGQGLSGNPVQLVAGARILHWRSTGWLTTRKA